MTRRTEAKAKTGVEDDADTGTVAQVLEVVPSRRRQELTLSLNAPQNQSDTAGEPDVTQFQAERRQKHPQQDPTWYERNNRAATIPEFQPGRLSQRSEPPAAIARAGVLIAEALQDLVEHATQQIHGSTEILLERMTRELRAHITTTGVDEWPPTRLGNVSCSVCGDSDSHEDHLLVECEECSRAFHQDCVQPRIGLNSTRERRKTAKWVPYICPDCKGEGTLKANHSTVANATPAPGGQKATHLDSADKASTNNPLMNRKTSAPQQVRLSSKGRSDGDGEATEPAVSKDGKVLDFAQRHKPQGYSKPTGLKRNVQCFACSSADVRHDDVLVPCVGHCGHHWHQSCVLPVIPPEFLNGGFWCERYDCHLTNEDPTSPREWPLKDARRNNRLLWDPDKKLDPGTQRYDLLIRRSFAVGDGINEAETYKRKDRKARTLVLVDGDITEDEVSTTSFDPHEDWKDRYSQASAKREKIRTRNSTVAVSKTRDTRSGGNFGDPISQRVGDGSVGNSSRRLSKRTTRRLTVPGMADEQQSDFAEVDVASTQSCYNNPLSEVSSENPGGALSMADTQAPNGSGNPSTTRKRSHNGGMDEDTRRVRR